MAYECEGKKPRNLNLGLSASKIPSKPDHIIRRQTKIHEVNLILHAYQLPKNIKINDHIGQGGTVFSESMLKSINLFLQK